MTAHTEEDQDALLAAGSIADMVKTMLVENWPVIVDASEDGDVPVAKVGVLLTVATSGINRQHIVKIRIPKKPHVDERATVADSEMPFFDTKHEIDSRSNEGEEEDGLP